MSASIYTVFSLSFLLRNFVLDFVLDSRAVLLSNVIEERSGDEDTKTREKKEWGARKKKGRKIKIKERREEEKKKEMKKREKIVGKKKKTKRKEERK